MLPRLLAGTCAKSSHALFLALVAIALALPSSASADLTHGLTVTTSDSTAGAHPDLGLDLTFGGSETPDALSLTLPSGLNIAPAAIASPCTNSQVLANSCPTASQIGTAALTGTGGVSGNGTLYMTESPASGGLAGIAAVVDMGASGIWTAQGSLSLSNLGESTLTQKIIFEPLPGTTSTNATVTITALGLNFVGTTGAPAHPLITNPSSCPATPANVVSTASSGTSSVQATVAYAAIACTALSFEPTFDETFSNPAAGELTQSTFTTNLPLGSSAIKRLALYLTPTLGWDFPAMGTTADRCPASSITSPPNPIFSPASCPPQARVGSVSMTTPLLAAPVTGALYIIEKSPLPWLGIAIDQAGAGLYSALAQSAPQVDVACDPIETGWCPSQIAITVLGLPEIPLTELQLKFGHEGRVGANGSALSDKFFRFVSAGDPACESPSQTRVVALPYKSTTPTELYDAVGMSGCSAGDPPNTTLTSSPQSPTNDSTPTFEFNSGDPLATFECKIDAAAYAPCSSPFTSAASLGDGSHRVRIRAVGEHGPDPSPVDVSFVIDTIAPVVTITAGPAEGATIDAGTVTFEFSSDDQSAVFECRMDGAPFSSCASPFTTPMLSDGQHGFDVRAIDSAANIGSPPAQRTFTVEAAVPNVNIDAGLLSVSLSSATANDLTLGLSHGKYMLDAVTGPLVAGSSCSQVDADTVSCLASMVTSIEVNGGDQNDAVTVSKRVTAPMLMSGGSGSDDFTSGSGADALYGGPGDDQLDGAASADIVTGGAGTDAIHAADGEPDTLTCDSAVDSATLDVVDVSNACTSIDVVSVAATVFVGLVPPEKAFVYLAAPGETNDVYVSASSRGATFTDAGNAQAGTGCAEAPGGIIRCADKDVIGLLVESGDGDDTLAVETTSTMWASLSGGDGNDTISSASAGGYLDGGAGSDRVKGGLGPDQIMGGDGDDSVDGGFGDDVFRGGEGVDTLDYGNRTENLNVSLVDGSMSNGQAGESDTVSGGLERVIGGSGNDSIVGNDAPNQIDAGMGEDTIDGMLGDDALLARDGIVDHVTCSGGSDDVTADVLDDVDQGCAQLDRHAVIRFVSGPAGGDSVSDATPQFGFSVDVATAGFECSVDGSAWEPCGSPYETATLADGAHELTVRAAVDSQIVAGPVSRSFSVDTIAPDVAIISGPEQDSTVGISSPVFEFTSLDAAASFECRVDGGTFWPCATPFRAALTYGDFDFEVRAVDAAGNHSSTEVRSFTVSEGGFVELTVAPANGAHLSVVTPPAFEFAATDSITTECAVDGGEFSLCSSPFTLDSPYIGRRSFSVRAIDLFGAPGEAVTRWFTFDDGDPADDELRPKTLLTRGPDGESTVPYIPVFEFTSNESARFFCRVDDGDWQECASPWTLTGLQPGEHRVEIGAEDDSFNFTDETIVRRFSYEPVALTEDEMAVAPPIERQNGLNPTVGFDLSDTAAVEVDIKTGHVMLTFDDVTPNLAAGSPLAVSRFYNSALETSDFSLTDRWRLGVGSDVRLVPQAVGDSIELIGPGGYEATFWRNEDGRSFTGPISLNAELSREADGSYKLVRSSDRDVLKFDVDGKLVSVTNEVGDVAAVQTQEVNGKSLLSSYGIDGGDTITAQYDAANRMDELTHSLPLGPVDFSYDAGGRLASTFSPGGSSIYEYDQNGYLDMVGLSDGTFIDLQIAVDGRVESVTITRGQDPPETTGFSYLASETVVTRPDGSAQHYAVDLTNDKIDDPSMHDQRSFALAEEYGFTPEQADEALNAQNQASGVTESVASRLGDGFAGSWFDPIQRELVVQVAQAGHVEEAQQIIDGSGASGVSRVEVVDHDIDELATAEQQLSDELMSLIEDGVVSISIDSELNRVVVETATSLSGAQAATVASAVGNVSAIATTQAVNQASFTVQPKAQRCRWGNRNYYTKCSRPVRGATQIRTELVNGCSSGFVGVVGRTPSVLTAGHCIYYGNVLDLGSKCKKATWRGLHISSPDNTQDGTTPGRYLGKSNRRFDYGGSHDDCDNDNLSGGGGDAGSVSIKSNGFWSTSHGFDPSIAYRGVNPEQWAADRSNPDRVSRPKMNIHGLGHAYKGVPICVSGGRSTAHCGVVRKSLTGYPTDDGAYVRGAIFVKYKGAQCGTVQGDSGGPAVSGNTAVGLLSGGVACDDYIQLLLDNLYSKKGQPRPGALSLLNACILVKGNGCVRLPVAGQSARVRVAGSAPNTQNLPAFYVSPGGADTQVSVQLALSPGGAIEYQSQPVPVGDGFAEVQLAPYTYASCILEDGGRYARVAARNAHGVTATDWVHLPKNCDVTMSQPPAVTVSNGRGSNSLGWSGSAVWLFDAHTQMGSFDLPAATHLSMTVGYENCDQNKTEFWQWADGFGAVAPDQLFNCRYVPKCHPAYCTDPELDPGPWINPDGSVTEIDLPADASYTQSVPGALDLTLNVGNPDNGCGDGTSRFRHITTPVFRFRVAGDPVASAVVEKRGAPGTGDYPSYICT